MRKISTFAIALMLGATTVNAQTVANFDTLTLVGTDTFYVNYSNPGNDVGFDDGLVHFECVYDTAGYSGLRKGFAYSNMTDSVDGTFNNLYSAKTAKGYNGSSQYLLASAYNSIGVKLKGKAAGQPVKGFYATNTTYGYNTMRYGDGNGFAKKFGGTPNTEADWFKITIKGYLNGAAKTDSVDFFLADFRDADSTKDYIIKTWEWVDLSSLKGVDSLSFQLSSTDTAGGFGMNNPAFFCMDNFETFETSSVGNTPASYVAKVYPNPATNKMYVEVNDHSVNEVVVRDMSGKVIGHFNATASTIEINTANYVPGMYTIQLSGAKGVATTRFVKQ